MKMKEGMKQWLQANVFSAVSYTCDLEKCNLGPT